MSSDIPATRTVVHTVRVEFGDCDPARIVWFPNFFRWIDAASRNFFVQCGVPPWHETERTLGIIGTPLVDTHAKFIKTVSYGDVLQIHTHVAEWRGSSFVHRHRMLRSNADGSTDLIMECDEVRVFAARLPGEATAIKAVAAPQDIRRLCE